MYILYIQHLLRVPPACGMLSMHAYASTSTRHRHQRVTHTTIIHLTSPHLISLSHSLATRHQPQKEKYDSASSRVSSSVQNTPETIRYIHYLQAKCVLYSLLYLPTAHHISHHIIHSSPPLTHPLTQPYSPTHSLTHSLTHITPSYKH